MADRKEMDSYEYARFIRKVEDVRNGDPHESSSERQKKVDELYDELGDFYGDWSDRAKTRLEDLG